METILQTVGLTKKYKGKAVVNNLNITVSKGDVYGFVGENGSGKTTVIRLLTSLIFPTSGSIEVKPEKGKIGAIVETPSIYLNMSASDNLRMQSTILGKISEDKIKATLELVGLGALYQDKKHASAFSLGMRQRLGIAMVLLADPEFIALDEPMNGLDPMGIVEMRELILTLNRERGITFLISSHILFELALVATKYGIISKGRLIKEITAEQLASECQSYITITSASPSLYEIACSVCGEAAVLKTDNGVKIFGTENLNAIMRAVVEHEIMLDSINCTSTGIEDYYLSLTGGNKNA